MSDDNLEPPRATSGDVAHTTCRAALSLVPVAGGPAVELFQALVTPPLEKRLNDWRVSVAQKLTELEGKVLELSDLQNNEQFTTAVLHATHIALRTHSEEKLGALRNAVLNVAKGQAPEDALQHFFLELVDSLTPLHIRLLRLAQSNPIPPKLDTFPAWEILEQHIQFQKRYDMGNQFWRDLKARGLVNPEELAFFLHEGPPKGTSKLGDEFLAFISE